jgi:polysaccharide export outer membrane protein
MRLSKVLLLMMLAAGASGCASLPPPRIAAAPAAATAGPAPSTAWATSLDGRIYGEPAPTPVAAPAAVKPTPFTALARLFQSGHPARATVAAAAPEAPVAVVAGPQPQSTVALAAPAAVKPTPFTALARLFERRRPAPMAAMAASPGAPVAVAAMPAFVEEAEVPYTLDTGDRLRIVVFGQEGLSNSYVIDAQGNLSIPLIGTIAARAHTTEELSHLIADRLRGGFIREPHVSIEIEMYRPFFILGEVIAPGQYPYVPHMTVETAVAIAGGFTPRAYRSDIHLDRPAAGGVVRRTVPTLTRVRPGDTIVVKERWF